MVTMQRVPPVTLGSASRPPTCRTSCRAIVSLSSRGSSWDRTAIPLSSTVSCQASCPAVKDTAIRPPRAGGNPWTKASVTSTSGDERE